MNTFIPKHHKSDVPEHLDRVAYADSFFPALSVTEFRTTMQQDDTVSNERIIEQIKAGMMMIAGDVTDWRSQQTASSINELGEVKKDAWRMAVFNRAKALIIENYRDIDTTKSGHNRADAMQPSINSYLQRSREMQSILTSSPRTVIKLV